MRFRNALLIGAVAVSAGCEGFLEPEAASFSSTGNYYQTPVHMERALAGTYGRLQAVFGGGELTGDWRNLGELRAENVTMQFDINLPSVNVGTLDEFIAFSDNSTVNRMWNNLYHTILQANLILDRIEGVEFSDASQKERIIGEAKFIRGLSYWMAVQYWGTGYPGDAGYDPNAPAVPLVVKETTTPAEAYPDGRASVGEVVAQIVADLNDAKAKLPVRYSGADVGRATRGAAAMLLGRTFLLSQEYGKALAEFEELESYGYSLMPSYRDVFDPGQKNNAESIFEIQFNASIEGEYQNMVPNMAPWNSPRGTPQGDPSTIVVYNMTPGGDFMPTQPFVQGYEEGDERKAATLDFYCAEDNSQYGDVNMRVGEQDCIPYFIKWRWPEYMPQAGRDDNNWIVFRYADALLSRAEALARLGREQEAVQFINRIRERAGLPGLPALSGDALLDALLRERGYELVGEGHRWFDLKRFGKAVEVIHAHGLERKERIARLSNDTYRLADNEWRLLYPIPPRVIELSKGALQQNPGWGSN